MPPAKRVVMSISVNPDLKKRMEKYGKEIKWSQVATKAFIEKLDDIERSRKMDIEITPDELTRLRKSKEQYYNASYEDGMTFGLKWAKGYAEFGWLKVLNDRFDEKELNESTFSWDWYLDFIVPVYGPNEAHDDEAMAEFEEDFFGDTSMEFRVRTLEFCNGFMDALVKMYEELNDESS